jgi:hypothetical protein
MKGAKRIAKMSLDFFFYFDDILKTTKERKDGSFEKIINVSRVYDISKCNRKVS